MLDRLVHAHATLALYADPTSLSEYRQEILPQIDGLPMFKWPELGDFANALWGAEWNRRSETRPTEITRKGAVESWRAHQNDGLYNTGGRRDPVALADEIEPLFPSTEPVRSLTTVQLAFVRAKLHEIGKKAGLPKKHRDFLVKMAVDGAKQKENPSAWRAIRDRKSDFLMREIRQVLTSLQNL